MENNYDQFWGTGSPEDVRLSYEDYLDMVQYLNEDRLTRKTQFNFKNLHEINAYGMGAVLGYAIPPACIITYLMMGRAQRSHSGYRYQWPYFFLAYPMTCWLMFTVPMPRRLYTEILTDPDLDGTYIRNRLKIAQPGLWRKISRQLFTKGYRFPEINELTENVTSFPTDFINKY